MRVPHITLAKLGLLFSIIIFGLISQGAIAHAQSGRSISWSDLTIENGWVCDAGKTNCTKGSSTASCRTYNGTGLSETQYHECVLTTGKGDTAVGITSTGVGGNAVQTVNEKTDGKITQIDKANAQTQNEIKNEQQSGGSCSLSSPSTWGDCILKAVASAVLVFANWLLGVAGVLFNLVMVYGVFQFANIIGNSKGVLTAWGILRDLANMALLFGFIFMGIATILDTGAVQNFTAKRALPSLLIFAILMNFSLFTTEALIDVSNALSASLYTQANTDPCTSQSGTNGITPQNCGITYGLAGHIMQSTGLSGIWAIKDGTPLGAETITLFGLALFATIGAIVFFAAAIMLAIRVIMLTLLMVVSPIGFAGMAIPPLRNLAGDWWQRVIHQAFYAPIMLLLILISLKIADSFTQAGANNDLGKSTLAAAVTGQDATVMGVFLVFMLVIGFMVASLIIANRFGAAGATAAVGFAKNRVLGIYGAASGFAGRNTFGRAGSYAQKRYESWAGNPDNKVLAPLFRNNTLLMQDAATATIGSVKDAKFGGKRTFEEAQQVAQKRKGQLTHAYEASKQKGELATAIESNDDKAVARILQQMNANDIKQTDYVKKSAEGIDILARNLSPEKFDDMMKDKEMEADQKEHLINGRFAQFTEQIKNKEAGEIRKWSPKDLEQLAKYKGDIFEGLIKAEQENGDSLISNDQFDKLKDSNVLSSTQRQIVKENAIGGKIEAALGKGDTLRATNLMNVIGGNKNKAKLSSKILTDPALANTFSVPELLAIATEDKLSGPDRIKLANIVQSRKNDPQIAKLLDPALNQAAAAYYTP